MSAPSNNEYYSTLELVINDQDANAPELHLANTSSKIAVNSRSEQFLVTSTPEAVAPEKEVYISPAQAGKEKKSKFRTLVYIIVLFVVLGIGIGTGIGVAMTKHQSSNPKFTSTAAAASRITPTSSTPTTAKSTSDATDFSRRSSTKSFFSQSFASTLSTQTTASSSIIRPLIITLTPSITAASISPTTCTWLGHCLGAPCKTFNDCSGTMICSNDNKCAPM